jgi:uncharacterized protein (TIGR02300 family)
VAKAELGTKRQCPKCGTRFYDLGKNDPITCIECEETFVPEVLLKPRRPVPATDRKITKAKDSADNVATTSDDSDEENSDLLEDDDDEDDIEGILEVEDDSIENELGGDVVINSDVKTSDEK